MKAKSLYQRWCDGEVIHHPVIHQHPAIVGRRAMSDDAPKFSKGYFIRVHGSEQGIPIPDDVSARWAFEAIQDNFHGLTLTNGEIMALRARAADYVPVALPVVTVGGKHTANRKSPIANRNSEMGKGKP